MALLKDVQKRDPKLPHTWFNLGIYYRKNGDAEQAIAQFEGDAEADARRADRALSTGRALQADGEEQPRRRRSSSRHRS